MFEVRNHFAEFVEDELVGHFENGVDVEVIAEVLDVFELDLDLGEGGVEVLLEDDKENDDLLNDLILLSCTPR